MSRESDMPETRALPVDLNKYHQAAIGFAVLNVIYLGLAYWKVPSFSFTGQTLATMFFFLLFVGGLAWWMYRGSKRLVVFLAAIYGARILVSIYTLTAGVAHPMVPFVLPTTVLCFYLFGRALWNWP